MLYAPPEHKFPKVLPKDSALLPHLTEYIDKRFTPSATAGKWLDNDTLHEIDIQQKVDSTILEFGYCHPLDARDLFYKDRRLPLSSFGPKIGWIGDLSDTYAIGNHFCHTKYGQYKLYKSERMQTYNAGMSITQPSRQGSQHIAIDCNCNPYAFFLDNRNMIVNPFPTGATVKVVNVEMDYPDRISPKDHGKGGNTIELKCYFDGDPGNFAPWNVLTIIFMHLKSGSALVKKGDILKTFGKPLAQIGISGYSGIIATNTSGVRGMHTHVQMSLTGGYWKIDPLAGPNNDTILSSVFYDQEFLLNLIDYEYAGSVGPDEDDPFPASYGDSCGYSNELRFSVDKSCMSAAHVIRPSEIPHKYTFTSNKPIKAIYFDRNPWGEWHPPSIGWSPSRWWTWIKSKLVKDMALPTSRNLMDYSCTPVAVDICAKYFIVGYQDSNGVLHKDEVPGSDRLSVAVHTCEFSVPSMKPLTDKGYGYYSFYAISFGGARSNRVLLKLEKAVVE